MVTLTIWRYDSGDGAHRAAEKLVTLAKSQLLTLHDAAVVWWAEGSKKPKLRQLRSLTGRGARAGAFWGLLFGLIFFMPLAGAAVGAAAGAAGGALRDFGIDDDMIRQIRDRLTPGTSALFVLSSDAVLDKVRDALADNEKPELMFTNLSTEQENLLREMFAEEPDDANLEGST